MRGNKAEFTPQKILATHGLAVKHEGPLVHDDAQSEFEFFGHTGIAHLFFNRIVLTNLPTVFGVIQVW